MKKTVLFILCWFCVHASQAQFRHASFLHHSVGTCFWDRSQVSNLTPPTTLPAEIAKYNLARGYSGGAAVTMTETYFPNQDNNGTADNNWSVWNTLFNGGSFNGSTLSYSSSIIIVKTCYLQQQAMTSSADIATLQGYIRNIVSVMAAHPNNFFVLWNNYPAPTDGASSRAVWSAQFSAWMKDVLAAGNDSYGAFPKNVYVFDVFRKLADGTTGFCPPQYGSGDEGPGGDHPSNAAVALLDSAIIRETFDAAIAYERTFAPVVTVQPPSNITMTGVQLNGTVNPKGSATSIHFEYGSTTAYGTSTSTQNVGAGSSPVSVNAAVSGLVAGTLYHYRLVATNTMGTTYSADSTVTTLSAVVPPPGVITLPAGSVSTTGAQLNGSVNPHGFATNYHFEYGTTISYGTSTGVSSGGSGSTAVPVNAAVTGLSPGTLYHYRLVASNSGGTVLGNDTTFTTAITPPASLTLQANVITTTGAQLNGSVNPRGFSTSYQFEYGTTTGYGSLTTSTDAGSGSGAVPVSAMLSGLIPGTLYHFRLAATNGGGTSYGFDSTFVTAYPPPTVLTSAAGSIGTTGAQLNGSVNPNGFAASYHFEYGTTTGYGSGTPVTAAGSGNSPVPVAAQITGLSAGTGYHFRLVATGSGGTVYGNDTSFTTAIVPPAAVTLPASSISMTAAQLNGSVNPGGFATYYHFEFGTTTAYGSSTFDENAGVGTGPVQVSATATSLAPETVYHYRLVATNGGGTTYGHDSTFLTVILPPSVVTSGADSISATGARLKGSVNPNGFASTWYFEYGTTAGYGTTTPVTGAGSGGTAVQVSAMVTGLAPGTLYHYRLSAADSGGTAHGADSTFRTTDIVTVSVIAFLQGPYAGTSMATGLKISGTLAAHFGSMPIPGLAVDSITIEIRDSVQGAQSTLRRFTPAWLLSDGTIRDFLDTTRNYVRFNGVASGAYYVVVRHRNHLAVMSSAPVSLDAGVPPAAYDFSTDQAKAYGANPMIATGTRYSLYAGDVNGDGVVKYTNANNDRVLIYNRIGGGSFNATVAGYFNEDVNLDGIVRYTNAGNDRVLIYVAIGGGSFNATVSTRVP